MKRERKEFIQVYYRLKGETYVGGFIKDEALDKLEDLTRSGAVITRIVNYDKEVDR